MLGAGGHATVLLDRIAACKDIVLRVVLNKNQAKWGKTFRDVLVQGGDDLVSGLTEDGITHFIISVGTTGNDLRANNSLTLHYHIVCNRYRSFMLRQSVLSLHRSVNGCKS
jgi:FlaA1/EpsC-like NDP-sugar epimerase